jgi:hypothetical protein
MNDRLRQRIRKHSMQIAAVYDVVLCAIALLEVDEGQAIMDSIRAPITPRQPDRLRPDRVQLVGQRERVKHLHGIGADVDAGAELREFGRLLEDLYFKALMAKRNGRCQSPESSPYDSSWRSDRATELRVTLGPP